jgi:hypothetical protein
MLSHFVEAGAPDDELLSIGIQLHLLLMQADIEQALTGVDRRVVLDIQAPDLRGLPWELLRRPNDQFPQFGDEQGPFCRGTLRGGSPLHPNEWPLRLMVVIGSQAGDPAVLAELELEQIKTALTPSDPDIDLLVWKRRGKADLVTQIQNFKPHILHFIGHGYAPAGEEPYLGLHNYTLPTRPIEKWQPSAIRADGLPASLRLVVINACHSDAASGNGLWSVTDAFLVSKVPAVIGMRSQVAGEDATRFSGGLYGALAQGKDLDVAVAKARALVWQARPDGQKRREWASACLQVLEPPQDILRIGMGIDPAQREVVQRARDFRQNRQLVGRKLERGRTWQGMASSGNGIFVVEGESDVGKTCFSYLLMERCALCGHDVRYIDFQLYLDNDPIRRRGDFLTVLRAIRDGNATARHILLEPFPPDKFGPFNRKLNEVLGATPPANEEDVDQHRPLTPEAYARAKDLFAAFRDCLQQSVTQSPLVIVLDHLESLLKTDFSNYLLPHLLEWSISRPDIHFVLVVTPTQYADFELSELEGDSYHVKVSKFPAEDWEELAMEYVQRIKPNEAPEYFEHVRAAIVALPTVIKTNEPWMPQKLKVFEI